ncbi:Endothelin-converting enzyme 1 [Trichostrongylus colubriformis]|uniref:Endothelin-converting enzyme 1 n=1 Tax=Trichostrongylus colubriformis TaxID=6319 RepID=A0AAN8FIV1_TRICO
MAKNNDMFVIPQAYKKYAAKLKDSEKSESVDGFTQDQLFFLGFSQMWCRKTGEFAIYERLSDVHPPPEIRVDMVPKNFPPFANAFHCSPESRMNLRHRCSIW